MLDKESKTFHFIAIGGVGQSALAKILAIKGFKVSGSDMVESKYTKTLEKLGVKVSIGHNKNNINENQIIVLSSAIKEDNPEYIRAKELNLPLYHRSDVLKLISDNYSCFIGFSGTHGKTTTSGLCSYILEKIQAKPAYATGGTVIGLDTNANAYKESEIFVAELDESDGTIIKYSPDYIVVNNLEPDHFDFYKNGEKDLLNQFDKFFSNLKETSKIFLNIDDVGISKFIESVENKNIITYSTKNKNANYHASDILITPEYNSFKLYKNNEFLGDIKTKLKGEHNVYNVLAVLSVLIKKGFNLQDMLPFVYSFVGMKRRFEVIYDGKIKIIDDYAHHPTEIIATLNSAKKQTERRIVAIFQPHRYTRLKALWNEFLNSFSLADKLFIVDTYSAGDKFDEVYNSENFAKKISHDGVEYIKGPMDEVAKSLSDKILDDDFVITIGAGDVTKVGQLLRGYYE